MSGRDALRGGAAGILAVWLAGSAAAADPRLCLSWPGEPVPLPQVNDADSARRRWAELRTSELARDAALAEEGAVAESQRLWRRVLCLDPEHAGAQRGLARTASVREHRPQLLWGVAPRRRDENPFAALSAPVIVRRAPEAPPPEPPSLARGRELIEAAQQSLDAARFSEALGRALAAREELQAGPASATARSLQLRTEVLAATAQVALGDEAGARESLGRAIAIDPSLALDPQTTSPKVLAALEAARAEGGAR